MFFQIAGFLDAGAKHGSLGIRPLLFDFGPRLLRSRNTPHLVEGVHIEGKVVQFPLVIGDGRIRVPVERNEGIHEIPDLFVGRMENMGPICVDMDSFDFPAVQIAAQLGTLVDDKAALPLLLRKMGERGAV